MSSRPEGACGVRTAGRRDEEMRRRREETERAVRIRLSCEELAQRAVERLLERDVTAGELLECGSRMLPSHYEDVVEERSIEHLCGYPLCSNTLVNVPKQRYAISVRSNRVYDITRRKSFCSNFCMRASNSFLTQIPSSPMWHRPHEPTPNFKLLQDGE
ncbi:putative RNA polymerase II subunit B1 CTD phosphatase RPAP2, partial [Lampetra fluviatilis]